jgi:hypothetical protein
MKYTYRCVKCKDEFTNEMSPKAYRQATGRFVSCCGEPMQLVSSGDDDEKRTVNKDDGGEIKKFLDKVQTKEMQCMCGETNELDEFIAYRHDGGLKDKENNKKHRQVPERELQKYIELYELK